MNLETLTPNVARSAAQFCATVLFPALFLPQVFFTLACSSGSAQLLSVKKLTG